MSAGRDLSAAANLFVSAYLSDEEEKAALAWEHVYDAFPVVPGAVRNITQEVGNLLGLEPEPEFRSGVWEQVAGALLEMKGAEAPFLERTLRAGGFPKKAENSYIWPFESP